ncbi:MAG: hypothetical protein ACR2FH_03350 [Caulobacteraceae bacterium]
MLHRISAGVVGLAALTWLAVTGARAGALRADDPAALARTHSLGDVIDQTRDRPVHILFVHGMRADRAGLAGPFMEGLCRYGPVCCPPGAAAPGAAARHFIDLKPWPRRAEVMGRAVWPDEKQWMASMPFVDRYRFERPGEPPVIVDEVNWWPLLMAFRCRILVAPESRLSGVDKAHLDLCRRWLTSAEYDDALKGPGALGGGAWANAALKRELVNWGLADAVIALGPMRTLIRRTIDLAFAYAAAFDERGVGGQEFVVVCESLGSFVVLDAAGDLFADAPKAREVVAATSDLYFFANQFALLELGRVRGLDDHAKPDLAAPAAATPPSEVSHFAVLSRWALGPTLPRDLAASPRPRQVIAFSDPSDALTYDVPPLPGAIVVNIHDRNEFDWFGLIADPTKAHSGHSRNPAVLKRMFERSPPVPGAAAPS